MYDIYIYEIYLTYKYKSYIQYHIMYHVYIYNIMRQGNPAHVGNPQSLHTNPYYCSDEYIIICFITVG